MGSIYIDGRTPGYPAIDQVIRNAGLNLRLWNGWQNNTRSTGGFEQLLGIVVHHTASGSGTSFDADWTYCAQNHQDAPVANLLLGRDGLVGLHSGGASNHAGKGGPWNCSRGQVPLDSGNSRLIGIEAQNNGVGENWAPIMCDAYEILCAALCEAYGFNPISDEPAHFQWAPSRKIDPWGGNQQTSGTDYTGPHEWIMPEFNNAVLVRMQGIPEPEPEEDDMAGYLWKDPRYNNIFLLGQGPATPVATAVLQKLQPVLGKPLSEAHDPTLAAICEQAWGLTIQEAKNQKLIIPQ